MAKKKTAEKAKIEAAPVLRSGGDDPTPETPVITKSYIMRDDWIDKGVVNTVAFKSVDGEVQDLLVNGEPAGGGGGGDFSVAHVTINDPNEYGTRINAPIILSSNQAWSHEFPNIPAIGWQFFTDDDTTGWVADIVMYKGTAIMYVNDGDRTATASGSIEVSGGYIKVTGDGSITIS